MPLIHPYIYSNTLITFYLFLYLYLDLICIEEELKSVGGFRFRYRVGGVTGAINPLNLKEFSPFIGLTKCHNIDYKALLLCGTKLDQTLIEGV